MPLGASPAAVPAQSLAVTVVRAENRAVSYTNKRSAFYYTQTHVNDHPEHAYFRGLNIAGRRIFSDYTLRHGGKLLDPRTAVAVVRPDALVRRYPQGAIETLRLFDGEDVVEIATEGTKGEVELRLRRRHRQVRGQRRRT